MSGPQLQRLGILMEPEPGNPTEAEGVLNPAAVRGPDGQLYLFPRIALADPELPQERHGIIASVVFPTGIDRRDDIDTPDRFDVNYGMADNLGVERLIVPEHLPSGAPADGDGPKAGGQE